jgi:hypothetical protein
MKKSFLILCKLILQNCFVDKLCLVGDEKEIFHRMKNDFGKLFYRQFVLACDGKGMWREIYLFYDELVTVFSISRCEVLVLS